MNVLKFLTKFWQILSPHFKALASYNRAVLIIQKKQAIHASFIIITFLGYVDVTIVTAFINLLFMSE